LIPELPEPPRRKRGLSEEDRALWESVAKQVKPLRKRRASKSVGRSREADSKSRRKPAASPGTPRRNESLLPQSRSRRRWRRSAAASGRICRAGGRRSTPGSTCTA
jgi:DNA-nicking Smr family endonuclease